MLSINRQFHFIGELNIKKSTFLNHIINPIQDDVNWMFLKDGIYRYSFVYKILYPTEAHYNSNFKVEVAFTLESILEKLKINHQYEVLRGEELIGLINLIKRLH